MSTSVIVAAGIPPVAAAPAGIPPAAAAAAAAALAALEEAKRQYASFTGEAAIAEWLRLAKNLSEARQAVANLLGAVGYTVSSSSCQGTGIHFGTNRFGRIGIWNLQSWPEAPFQPEWLELQEGPAVGECRRFRIVSSVAQDGAVQDPQDSAVQDRAVQDPQDHEDDPHHHEDDPHTHEDDLRVRFPHLTDVSRSEAFYLAKF